MYWGLETSTRGLAWPGTSTDNLVWGRFNGFSEVGVVLAGKNLQKSKSRVKISNSFYIRWLLQHSPPSLAILIKQEF